MYHCSHGRSSRGTLTTRITTQIATMPQGCQVVGAMTEATTPTTSRRISTTNRHRRTLMWVCMCRTTTSSRLSIFFDSAMPPSCQAAGGPRT